MTSSVPVATAFEYAGDGTTRTFAFPVRFLEATEIAVKVTLANGDEQPKTIGANYTVTGAGTPSGGSITFFAAQAPASGSVVKLSRRTAPKQTVDLGDLSKTPGDSLEQQLDRLAMALQDMEQRFLDVETTPGPPGLTSFLFGDVAPASDLGNDSDIYVDRITGFLYKKVAGAWVYQTGITGPKGDKGDKGDQGDLGDFDAAGTVARVTALENEGLKPGDCAISFRKLVTDPDGFLILTAARTIGDASSGADVDDDKCEDLFAALYDDYDNAALPILDDAGAPTTRGASAAADWAAHKRLPMPDPYDRFLRFASGTRATGTKEANQNKQHNHTASFTGTPLGTHSHNTTLPGSRGINGVGGRRYFSSGDSVDSGSGAVSTSAVSAGTPAGTVTVNDQGSDEARPDSFVMTCLIKL